MPPFDPISDNDHLEQRIVFHMNKADIRRDKNRHCGFHSLCHSAGSMLLDMGTPLSCGGCQPVSSVGMSLQGLVMPVFFRILYTSGMRASELRLARLGDVNLEEGYIRVRQGKKHKDRHVPIHPDLVKKCINLKEQIHQTSPENEFFFMLRPGCEMKLFNVYHNFRRYLDKAGIPHIGHGPRVHDFRHTYCVNLLRKWIEEGKDPMVYLPYMRAMLGHETFEETAYYLKLTTAAFPSIGDSLDKTFPDIIGEVSFSEHEYY